MKREEDVWLNPPMTSAAPEAQPLTWHDLPEGFGVSWRCTPTGVRWRFLEVLRGRFLLVFLLASAMLLLVFVGGGFFAFGVAGMEQRLAALFAVFAGLAVGDEYEVAINLTGWLLALIPILAPYLLFATLIVLVVYNLRERKVGQPSTRAREVHAYDARIGWNVVFATMLGILCFTVLFLAVSLAFDFAWNLLRMGGLLSLDYQTSENTRLYLSFVALMLSELPSRRIAGDGSANALIAEGLAAGGYDRWLPERLRDPEGRALVARLLGVGAAETVKGAVLLTRLIDLHETLEETSDVLSELADAFATILTFGVFARVIGAAEEVASVCAEHAKRGVTFGDPDFVWPSEDAEERRRRNRRTILAAALLFACIVAAQPFLSIAG